MRAERAGIVAAARGPGLDVAIYPPFTPIDAAVAAADGIAIGGR